MAEQSDYYSILELDRNCTMAEIDSAYRRMAVRWHPDKNKDNKELAEKKFREISHAYQLLSNEDSREAYDKSGSSTSTNLFDPYLIFKNMFEEDNAIPNVFVKIEAGIDRLYTGFTETIKYTRYNQCSSCNATGTRNGEEAICGNCKGLGVLMGTIKGGKMGYMIDESQCFECDGKGIDSCAKLCKKCNGDKYKQEEIRCDVHIPPGAYDNYHIKLEAEGNFIPKNERKGKTARTDVIVVIKEKIDPDCVFKRGMFIRELNRINLADILMPVDITFEESIVGVKKEIEYINGESVCIDIDDIVQNGDVYVIKNKGMNVVSNEATKSETRKGDLFLHFRVSKPNLNQTKRNRIWQIITDTAYPDIDDFDTEDLSETIPLDTYISENKTETKSDSESESDSDSESDSESVTESESVTDSEQDSSVSNSESDD